MDLSGIWVWISDPANRDLLKWVGGILAAVMAAGWAFYKHFSQRSKLTPSKTGSNGGLVTNHVTATTSGSDHEVVATGSVSIGSPVDVNAIVNTLVATHREDVVTREREIDVWKQQAQAAVEVLANLRDQKGAPPSINEALALLKQGNTKAAEGIFQAIAHRKEARIAGNKKEAAAAYRHLGALAYLNDPQKALDAYRRATKLDPDNAAGWNRLGQLFYRTGEPSKAETAFRRVLSLCRAQNDRFLLAMAFKDLGVIYKTRGDLDQAEAIHCKSLEIDKALDNKAGMAADYANLGAIYQIRGELEHAEAMYDKSFEINKALGRKEGMAYAYANLGVVYKKRGNLDQAEAMYQKSLGLFEQLKAKGESAQVQRWLDGLLEAKRESIQVPRRLGALRRR
jgi:tetratricopeptide (TPR) repeat protein